MPRETLDRHIKQLLDEILTLDSQVECAIRNSVEALKSQKVRRIILTRPAIEAGESLGFMAGRLLRVRFNGYYRASSNSR